MNDDEMNATPLSAYVFMTHGDAMYRYVFTRVNFDHDIADDIRAQALERMHRTRKPPTSRSGPAFTAWVFAVTRNTTADYFRQEARRKEIPYARMDPEAVPVATKESPEQEPPSPIDVALQIVDRVALLHAWAALTPLHRTVLRYRAAGYANQEIATMLNMHEPEAHKKVSRIFNDAKREFKRLLGEDAEIEPGGT